MRFIRTVFVLLFVSVFINCSAQNIPDTLISSFRDFYVNKLKYKLEKIVDVENPADGKMPRGNDIPCYSGKEVLVVALFSAKPQELYGRMLVSKNTTVRLTMMNILFSLHNGGKTLKIIMLLSMFCFRKKPTILTALFCCRCQIKRTAATR